MKIIAWSALCCTFLVSAYAEEAGCSKAAKPAEKLICASDELSRLDGEMSTVYNRALHAESSRNILADIRASQEQWLKRRNSCPDIACIKDEYQARIELLLKISSASAIQNSKSLKSDEAVCQMVADYIDTQNLDVSAGSLSPPETELGQRTGDLRQIFGEKTAFSGTGKYLSLDLNGDGTPEYFAIYPAGTAYVISSHQGAATDSIYDDDEGDHPLSLIKVGGRYFVLSKSVGPGKLWRVNRRGAFEQVCMFSPGRPKLVVGKQHPVCSEAEQGSIKYVEYKFDHTVRASVVDRHSITPYAGLAKLYLDNDGVLDNIIRIENTSYRNDRCDSFYIAATNEKGDEIPDNRLNQLLAELHEHACNAYSDAFIYDENTYIDAKINSAYSFGNRRILRIFQGEMQTICEFRDHLTVSYLLTPDISQQKLTQARDANWRECAWGDVPPDEQLPAIPVWACKAAIKRQLFQDFAPARRPDYFDEYILKGDFDGDRQPDAALWIKSRKTNKIGLAIFNSGSTEVFVIGAGDATGRGDDLKIFDLWSLLPKQKLTSPLEAQPVYPAGNAIFLNTPDSGAAALYWDGKAYTWFRISD